MMEPLFVKIHEARGYGSDPWRITARTSVEYDLLNPKTQRRVHLYRAHCYEDMETKRMGFEARTAMADRHLGQSHQKSQEVRDAASR